MQRRAALLGLATLLLGPATARAQAGHAAAAPGGGTAGRRRAAAHGGDVLRRAAAGPAAPDPAAARRRGQPAAVGGRGAAPVGRHDAAPGAGWRPGGRTATRARTARP